MKRIAVFLSACVVASASLAITPGVAQTPTEGGVTVGPVEYVTFVPFDGSTSTGVTIHGKYMYLTSWKAISIYDISDPENPVQTDTLPVGFMFENEDVEIHPTRTTSSSLRPSPTRTSTSTTSRTRPTSSS